jgi:hypothetical protein
MFYAALALLARQEISAGRHLVHKLVAETLMHFFISSDLARCLPLACPRSVLEKHVEILSLNSS